MSAPKLISPLLDGFVMGPPISSHHGVRCCPAMRHNSDNKYIVKIISVPSSQSQLDALLLTGAYKDPGEAMDYFRSLAEGIAEDAELLRTVSKLEGFLPYDGYQIVPMGDNLLGYSVYLVGSYKRSLDKYMRRNPDSAFEDVLKLGLDLCSALSAARRAGYMYIALKPSNIFLSDDKEFRIGDLGFVALDSLEYTSLPAKFRSPYCPPEVADPMHTLNATVDTYAAGLILYQVCNGGKLPEADEESGCVSAPPIHGSEQLHGVIMKAIAPDPDQRYASPVEMGQALASCLPESNSDLSDPHKFDTRVFPADSVIPASSEGAQDTKVIPTAQIKSAVDTSAAARSGDTKVIPTEAINEVISGYRSPASVTADTNVIPDSLRTESICADTKVIPTAAAAGGKTSAQCEHSEDRKEVSQDTKIVAAVGAASAPAQKHAAEAAPCVFDDDGDEEYEEDVPRSIPSPRRRTQKVNIVKWIVILLILALLGGIGYSAYYYYNTYYIQTIDSMTITGVHDNLTVHVATQTDESLLTVTCSDTYGNSAKKKLTNGIVEFTDLLPNSQYKISIEIEGFHQLVGKTSDVFNTESRTEIVSFTGIAGSEDGSVMLTFTVNGPEPDRWILSYQAEGEETLTEEFTGHSVTIRNLSFPKVYTFELSPSEEMFLTGQTSLEFSSTSLVLARNLAITSYEGDEMHVAWEQPADASVQNWTVRCYSDGGYDQTLETADTQAVFSQIDPSYVYYVEVTAEGMTQPSRTSITANPITITDLNIDESDPEKLTVSWDFLGKAPDGGWLLMYSLDGSNTQSIVKCAGATAEISPRIHGSQYKFVIQAADSTSIFENERTYLCPEAEVYKEHSFDASRTTAFLLRTPEREDWNSSNVSKEDYQDVFKSGEPISIQLFCDNRFYIPADEISILYVIRNADGQAISNLVSQATDDWHDLWVTHNANYGELDLPEAPTEVGSYTVSIYFDGKFIAKASFSITDE